jgi:hypothetical protein
MTIDIPRDSEGLFCRFINRYECECGATWEDQWSATCDDECPECGADCSPTDSDELETPMGNALAWLGETAEVGPTLKTKAASQSAPQPTKSPSSVYDGQRRSKPPASCWPCCAT